MQIITPIIIYWASGFVAELTFFYMGIEVEVNLSLWVTTLGATISLFFLIPLYRANRMKATLYQNQLKKYIGQIGLLGICACIFGNGCIYYLSFVQNTWESTKEVIYSSPLWQQLLCVGIIIPVAEELVFRGLSYEAMKKKIPLRSAMICSALLFGLFHGNLAQGIYGFLLGFLLVWLQEHFRGVWAPILMHSVANISSILISRGTQLIKWEQSDIVIVLQLVVSGFGIMILVKKMREERNKHEVVINRNPLL